LSSFASLTPSQVGSFRPDRMRATKFLYIPTIKSVKMRGANSEEVEVVRFKKFGALLAFSFSILFITSLLVSVVVAKPLDLVSKGAKNPSSEVIKIVIDFPSPEITAVNGYDQVSVDGLDSAGNAGEPLLPIRTVSVLVPFGRDVNDVNVVPGEKVTLDESYTVEPGQKCVPLDSLDSAVGFTPPDSKIYGSSSAFPAQLSSDESVQSKMGYKILSLNLHPVSYIPATGEISYFKSLTVEVRTSPSATTKNELPVNNSINAKKVIEGAVDNPDSIGTYSEAPVMRGTSLLDQENYQYVIITNEQLKNSSISDNWGALMAEKNSRGITTNLVTTEWIYANYDGTRPDGGTDNPTKIRNFIIDAYTNWGTEYVLLGGYSGIIPLRTFYTDGTEIPADLYYACLDGTFDNNADGEYGQPDDGVGGGEVDLLAEVYVGRAAVANEQEVSNFVRKTITYETQNPNYLRQAYMLGEYLGFGGISDYATASMEEIRLGSDAHGYHTEGFASSNFFEVSTLYDAPDYSWPKSDLISIIDNGVHILNHLGHANQYTDMKLNTSDLYSLTNDEYFFGYSQGCLPGAFDSPNCFAEVATTIGNGAFAFIANSRYGWGMTYSTDGPSERYNRMFWHEVFAEDMLNIGMANQESKENLSSRINEECMRWCYYEINLFGDPEVQFQMICNEGVVNADRKFYLPTDNVTVTVRDLNLNLNPESPDTATVEISSAKEPTPENITVIETGPSTSTFVGLISLDNVGPSTPDGKLQVLNEDNLTVTYNDENDGLGNPSVSVFTAIVDGVSPPTPNLLYPSDGASVSKIYTVFRWTAVEDYSGVVKYTFQVDNNPSFTDPDERSGLVDNCYQLDITLANGSYYWRVRAVDGVGNPGEWSDPWQFTLEINTHEPIFIQGNNDFDAAHGVTGGSGSSQDPYLIENLAIIASFAHGIHIKNTNAYFTILNCQVEGGPNQYHGIYLENVRNGRIENTIVENVYYGTAIYMSNSSYNTLTGNTVPNGYYGIYLTYSPNNTFTGNTTLNDVAIVVMDSNNNIFTSNTASSGTFDTPAICLVNSDNNTLTYNLLSSSDYGFYLQDSDDLVLEYNLISNNGYGIFAYGANNAAINYNNVSNSIGTAISVNSSSNSTLTGNTISNNYGGISLEYTSYNTLTGNSMLGNGSNFGVRGNTLSHYIQYIDTSNTVDGKPIYYYVSQGSKQVPSDAGFVGIVNSDNITASGLTLTNNSTGVLLVYSTNSRIENVVASNNSNGISLSNSSYNTLAGNTTSNNFIGIALEYSNYNDLSANTSSNNRSGIGLYSSSNNQLTGNSVENSSLYGISINISTNNTVTNNSVSNNDYYGLYLSSSGSNLVYNNYFSNTHNAYANYSNTWNVSPTPGINIVGGPYLGGNYWSDYSGVDQDEDYLGDTLLPYNSNGGITSGGDYHPLIPCENAPLQTPTLTSPSNGSTLNDNTPTLRWTAVTDPSGVKYTLQYSTDNSFQTGTTVENLTDNAYTVPTNMALVDAKYYWRVRAANGAGGISDWSGIWWFTIDATPPQVPTLTSPSNGSLLNDNTPTLRWTAVNDPSGVKYTLQYSTDNTFQTGTTVENLTDNAYTVPTNLALVDAKYYWRVRAVDGAGNNGNWSGFWSFTIDATPPQAPTQISPSNGSNMNDNTPTFRWSAVSDPSGVKYRLQYSTDNSFQTGTTVDNLLDNTYTVPDTGSLAENKYYWRVRATDGAGNAGNFSGVWWFTVSTDAITNGSFVSNTNNWAFSIVSGSPTGSWDSAGYANGGCAKISSEVGRSKVGQGYWGQAISTTVYTGSTVKLSYAWKKGYARVAPSQQNIYITIVKPDASTVDIDSQLGSPGAYDTWYTVSEKDVSSFFDQTGTYQIRLRYDYKTGSNSSAQAIVWFDEVKLTVAVSTKPTIELSPTSLAFNAVQGGTNPLPQTVTVTNTGSVLSTLNWGATDNASWLSESPTSGSLAGAESEPMTVSADITGLAAGTYNATITVSDPNATNSPRTVGVELIILPAGPNDVIVNGSFVSSTSSWSFVKVAGNPTGSWDSTGYDNGGCAKISSEVGKSKSGQGYWEETISTTIYTGSTVKLSYAWKKGYAGVAPSQRDIYITIVKPSGATADIDSKLGAPTAYNTWYTVSDKDVSSYFNETGTYKIRLRFVYKTGSNSSAQALAWFDEVKLLVSA
jgi:parallel beta-helix repeat protein